MSSTLFGGSEKAFVDVTRGSTFNHTNESPVITSNVSFNEFELPAIQEVTVLNTFSAAKIYPGRVLIC